MSTYMTLHGIDFLYIIIAIDVYYCYCVSSICGYAETAARERTTPMIIMCVGRIATVDEVHAFAPSGTTVR